MTIPHPKSAPYFIAALYGKQPPPLVGAVQNSRGLPTASASIASPCAAVTAAVVAAAATKIASRTVFHRARLIYRERASAEVLSVPRLNRLLCILIGRHLDESETLRTAAHLIHDDDSRLDGSALCESILELCVVAAMSVSITLYFSYFATGCSSK